MSIEVVVLDRSIGLVECQFPVAGEDEAYLALEQMQQQYGPQYLVSLIYPTGVSRSVNGQGE